MFLPLRNRIHIFAPPCNILCVLKLAAMLRDGFGENPWFGCVIAEELQCPEENHSLPKRRAVGYALFYHIYSTWEGRAIFMEDLYVEPASRGIKIKIIVIIMMMMIIIIINHVKMCGLLFLYNNYIFHVVYWYNYQ